GEIVCTIIAREEKAVREYKNGKQTALQYLVGEAMRESRGAGNPQKLQKLFVEKIK
ncbi:Asp-tRNA(Asn)/Glu-tRNA(Gln) amidotransferase GatCAB subunit B, partial [Candidatus Kaiserbacteria bacterium CG17_big_fil_post_rev_8_21_14_2_50_51_7]